MCSGGLLVCFHYYTYKIEPFIIKIYNIKRSVKIFRECGSNCPFSFLNLYTSCLYSVHTSVLPQHHIITSPQSFSVSCFQISTLMSMTMYLTKYACHISYYLVSKILSNNNWLMLCKVCSINFQPPSESPWINAIPAQLWLLFVKIRSSWQDHIHSACSKLPKVKHNN